MVKLNVRIKTDTLSGLDSSVTSWKSAFLYQPEQWK